MRFVRRVIIAAVLAASLTPGASAAEEIQRFEIRRSNGQSPGKLVVHLRDRELNLSAQAANAWKGWLPEILLFTEVHSDGRHELRSFNAITGARRTITVETLPIHDVTSARLEGGEYRIVLFLRDNSGRVPALALAHPEQGVYRRIRSATAGAILNDRIEVLHFDPDIVNANAQDLQDRRPQRREVISLATGSPLPNSGKTPSR